jgi:CO/xanthine dehydrogenase Mo-binding subunit
LKKIQGAYPVETYHIANLAGNVKAPDKVKEAHVTGAYSVIGKPIKNIEALEKTKGAACYTDDMKLPGMLYGKIKRSVYPSARILSIDTGKALKLSGVRAVIKAQDVTQYPWGHFVADELPLTGEYARYIGDELAAVAAVNAETAEEALDLIEVGY